MIRKTLFILSIAVLSVAAVFSVSNNTASAAATAEITIQGKLQKTVEPGGWVLLSEKEKYLILNSRQFAGESWFAEGAGVEATGEVKKDVMTTFMEGTPFEARSMRPLQQSGGPGGSNRDTTRVLVTGDSIVQAQPDTAILVVSVVTQGKRAIDAQQENATKSEAVIRALKAAAGAGAEVKTSGYSIQPQRVYKENQPPTIVGYEARNSVTVTLNILSKVGDVIDAAAEAGANDIANISFTLRQDRQVRDRALSEATRTAVAKARVVAEALGGRLLRVAEVQEEGYVRPRPIEAQYDNIRTMKAATPIEIGSLDITARVQLIAEIQTDK
jgi:uncharacterized protein YggE